FGLFWRERGCDLWDGEEREQVVHVEVVLVHAGERREHRLERLLALSKRDHVERHRAERHRTGRGGEGHLRVRGVERERRQERERPRPRRAPRVETRVLAVERFTES